MVEKLDLLLTPHPRPYMLRRCRDRLDVTHQTTVQFFVGNFSSKVLCDVIPVPLVSCHMLLGELWSKENGATYNHRDSTYAVAHGKEYVLKPLEKKIFRTWRNDRLQKIKKQEAEAKFRALEEAKRREAAKAALFPVPVPSTEREADAAAEIFKEAVQFPHNVSNNDLKPRTVSPKGGEDDEAPPILNIGLLHGFNGQICMHYYFGCPGLHACKIGRAHV